MFKKIFYFQKLICFSIFSNNEGQLKNGNWKRIVSDVLSLLLVLILPIVFIFFDKMFPSEVLSNSFIFIFIYIFINWINIYENGYIRYIPLKKSFMIFNTYLSIFIITIITVLFLFDLFVVFNFLDIIKRSFNFDYFKYRMFEVIFSSALQLIFCNIILFTCFVKSIIFKIGFRLLLASVIFFGWWNLYDKLPKESDMIMLNLNLQQVLIFVVISVASSFVFSWLSIKIKF